MADSPCVRNCCLDQQDICLGCGRSVEEIIEWHSADLLRRTQILQLAQARLAQRNSADSVKHRAVNPSE
ncbi:DUF1289 domain-containing protein [Rheinheimera muenzenbergensis]|uniref:DUF1289 domain-containing protein n=1 Tax=Rheinheimera muenzenbergensis TaxID=1193628 RepID=A0ABU8C5L2_9GAMM